MELHVATQRQHQSHTNDADHAGILPVRPKRRAYPRPLTAVAATPGCDAGRSYGSGWLRPDEFRSIQTAKQRSVISLIVAPLVVPAILWRRVPAERRRFFAANANTPYSTSG